jgi:lysophospholipase L1-like esterase
MKASKIVCLGDSHTQGQLGANWLNLLQPDVSRQLINAGVNGEMAHTISRRLECVLTINPGASALVLLAGTNDILAQSNWAFALYHRYIRRQLPPEYTFKIFTDHMEQVLTTFALRAPGAPVFVVTMPPIGEDLTSSLNAHVERYNTATRDLCARHSNARLVDFHDACRRYLQQQAELPGARPATRYVNHPLFMPTLGVSGYIQRYLMGRSWDSIARKRGMHLLVDHIHLNDTAAQLLADLLRPLLQQQEQQQHQEQ